MQYNPAVTDRSADYVLAAAQTNADMMNNIGSNIGGALMSIGKKYADNKAMKTKAKSYAHIADILGSSMFGKNAAVQGFLGEIKGMKDPEAQVMGYEQLFNLVGPLSNAQMAQTRFEQATSQPYVNAAAAQAKAAAAGQAFVDPHQTFKNINFGAVE